MDIQPNEGMNRLAQIEQYAGEPEKIYCANFLFRPDGRPVFVENSHLGGFWLLTFIDRVSRPLSVNFKKRHDRHEKNIEKVFVGACQCHRLS